MLGRMRNILRISNISAYGILCLDSYRNMQNKRQLFKNIQKATLFQPD